MNPRITAISFVLLISSMSLTAQTAAVIPIPAEFTSAHTVFVANAGSEANDISERAYSVLYAGLTQWNHYQVVSGPPTADMILELRYTCPLININVTNGSSFPPNYNPRFQLVILDRATGVILWSATEFPFGTRKQTFEETNDNAVNALLADLKALAAGHFPSQAATSAPSAKEK